MMQQRILRQQLGSYTSFVYMVIIRNATLHC